MKKMVDPAFSGACINNYVVYVTHTHIHTRARSRTPIPISSNNAYLFADQDGLVSSDVIIDACADGADAVDPCLASPLAPACAGVAVACGAYAVGHFFADLFG